MLTLEDFETARAIAEKLNIPQEFGIDLEDDYFDPDDLVDQVSALNVGEFSVDNGVSKVVIIFDAFNFVIKIPFNGGWYNQTEYNEEEDEYECVDRYFEPFSGAYAPDQSDYCWDECICISDACDMGFGALFPTTSFLCEVEGQRFYIQEKVNTMRHFHPTPSENSLTRAKNLDSDYRYCDTDWRAMVIELYGEDFLRSFIDWYRNDNSNHILDDMHGGNYGYRMDGAPIILDCAGFRDG